MRWAGYWVAEVTGIETMDPVAMAKIQCQVRGQGWKSEEL
jgi:hypothetical protein